MSRKGTKDTSEKPAGKVLVRFSPPGGGVPRTIGETIDGQQIIISPNVVRKSGLVCHGIRPPYYVWVLYHYTGPTTTVSLRGFAVTGKASRGEIDQFVNDRGQGNVLNERRKFRKHQASGKDARRKGSKRRYKRPAYQDYAGDKPAM